MAGSTSTTKTAPSGTVHFREISPAWGGGITIGDLGGSFAVEFCTFTNNTATDQSGDGVYVEDDLSNTTPVTIEFKSTVISGNTYQELLIPENNNVTVSIDYCAIGSSASIAAQNTANSYLVSSTHALSFSDHKDLQLGALASNGGPTQTHLPGSKSLLLNAIGSTVYSADLLDQRSYVRLNSFALDIGSVEVEGLDTAVTSFTVNNGAAQRSRLTTITVNFSTAIPASALMDPGSIILVRTKALSTGIVGTIVQTGATGANGRILVSPGTGTASSFTLTFDNADAGNQSQGVDYQSLADGRWQLSVLGGFQSTLNDATLRRLYGDINNDGTVDGSTDFAQFGATFGLSFGDLFFQPAFDFNFDGFIGGSVDFAQFGQRFGVTL